MAVLYKRGLFVESLNGFPRKKKTQNGFLNVTEETLVGKKMWNRFSNL